MKTHQHRPASPSTSQRAAAPPERKTTSMRPSVQELHVRSIERNEGARIVKSMKKQIAPLGADYERDTKRLDPLSVAEDVIVSLSLEVSDGMIAAGQAGLDEGTLRVAEDQRGVQGIILHRWGPGRRSLQLTWMTTAPGNLPHPLNRNPVNGVGWALVQPLLTEANGAGVPIVVSASGPVAVNSYMRYGFRKVPGHVKDMMRPSPKVTAAIARRPLDAPRLLALEYTLATSDRQAQVDAAQQAFVAALDESQREAPLELSSVLGLRPQEDPGMSSLRDEKSSSGPRLDPNMSFFHMGAEFAARFRR